MAMKDAISLSNYYSERKGAKAVLNLYRMTLYARKIVLDKSNDDTAKKRRLRNARARQKAEQEAQNRDRRAAPRAARLLHRPALIL